jgi:RND family efflux transporter MFP subunit
MSLDKAALESLRLDRGTETADYRDAPGKRRRWWIVAAVAALLMAGLAWRMFSGAVPVQTATVEAPEGANGEVLNASGYVTARRLATVSSKVTGRVTEVLFEEGAEVKEGQVLARLDPATIRAEFNVADKGLEAARRNLDEIEVRLADARRTLERNRSLVERKLIAQSAVDSSAADVAALQARLAAANAEVGVARSQVALSQQALDDLDVRAPFTGVVISKDAQPGETVSPMSAGGGFTRTGIATIVDMDSREIEVDVNEAYINRVHDGQKVESILDAYPDWRIPGHVISIVPTADRQKATVRVRIAFDQLDARILPDMGIKVSFYEPATAAAPKQGAKIPDKALVKDGTATYVWLVRDSTVQKHPVKAGTAAGGEVSILDGLQGGEVVVVDPPARLRDGGPVELKAAK